MNPRTFCLLFYMVFKEKMLTTKIEAKAQSLLFYKKDKVLFSLTMKIEYKYSVT